MYCRHIILQIYIIHKFRNTFYTPFSPTHGSSAGLLGIHGALGPGEHRQGIAMANMLVPARLRPAPKPPAPPPGRATENGPKTRKPTPEKHRKKGDTQPGEPRQPKTPPKGLRWEPSAQQALNTSRIRAVEIRGYG